LWGKLHKNYYIISIVLCNSTLFNQGYDVGVIQTILRHKSPNTTERYLKSIGMERERDALESLPSKPAEVVSIDRVYETNVRRMK
jgi:hypothetical protein